MNQPEGQIGDLNKLKEIFMDAAVMVQKYYMSDSEVNFKLDGSPVSIADTEVDRFLRDKLMALYPEAGWLSEETIDDQVRLQKEEVWIVDPIDGTKEFLKGIPECAISVGLVRNGNVVAGGVLNPIKGEGGVTTISGEIEFWGFDSHANLPQGDRSVTASVSRTEFYNGSMKSYLNFFDRTIPVGSVAYKLLRVAAGVDDVTLSMQPKSEWDVCGGIALIQAVGKEYRRIDGNPIKFNQEDPRFGSGAVAGALPIVQRVIERISRNRNG